MCGPLSHAEYIIVFLRDLHQIIFRLATLGLNPFYAGRI